MVQQYISFVISGLSPRMQLIWQTFGCTSWDDFCKTRPVMADFAQSLFLMIAALLDKRLGKVKRNPSNEAARLCDHRESAEMRLTIAEKLRSKRKCCVGDVVVTLVHKPETVQAVFDKPAQIRRTRPTRLR